MPSPLTFQSMPLTDLAREPAGTIGVYFCDWDNLQIAQCRIHSVFKMQSLDKKGKCHIQTFSGLDHKKGTSFRVLQVEVIEPIPPRKRRGRPLGVKNKPKS